MRAESWIKNSYILVHDSDKKMESGHFNNEGRTLWELRYEYYMVPLQYVVHVSARRGPYSKVHREQVIMKNNIVRNRLLGHLITVAQSRHIASQGRSSDLYHSRGETETKFSRIEMESHSFVSFSISDIPFTDVLRRFGRSFNQLDQYTLQYLALFCVRKAFYSLKIHFWDCLQTTAKAKSYGTDCNLWRNRRYRWISDIVSFFD